MDRQIVVYRDAPGSPSGGAAEVAHTGAEGVSNVGCWYALTDDTSPDLAGARPPSPEGRARVHQTTIYRSGFAGERYKKIDIFLFLG